MTTTYHVGGYLPDRPAQNKATHADPVAGTFTQWDDKGRVIEQRALTSTELASLAQLAVDRRGELLALLDESPLMLDELHEVLRIALTEGLL